MGGACGAHGRDEKSIQNCIRENPKGREHLGDCVVDGRKNIKIGIKGIGCDVVGWIHSA
jgi:hypothetical protein